MRMPRGAYYHGRPEPGARSSAAIFGLLGLAAIVITFGSCDGPREAYAQARPATARCSVYEFKTTADSSYYEVACPRGLRPTVP